MCFRSARKSGRYFALNHGLEMKNAIHNSYDALIRYRAGASQAWSVNMHHNGFKHAKLQEFPRHDVPKPLKNSSITSELRSYALATRCPTMTI